MCHMTILRAEVTLSIFELCTLKIYMLRFPLFFCEILVGWCSSLPEKFVAVLFLVGKLVMTFEPNLVNYSLVTYHMKEHLITF